MRTRLPLATRATMLAAMIAAVSACGGSSETAPMAAQSGANPAPGSGACAALQQRIDRCKANLPAGTTRFELGWDPGTAPNDEVCVEANKELDGMFKSVGCENR
ncbi:MAG: hypothetical protein LKM32_15115 [Chiayiivirga sp.]|jgi:hypothetical protein|uniref:hypothetical protein n=1 Tax=Chiayiivirga sp. TaxID=2041042 RepID=UPI0025BC106E|nr:hypothetical protein [Chiayiivirga sp.]MCI1730649.1 hypothetical protein [Chiayiivirga sp.]